MFGRRVVLLAQLKTKRRSKSLKQVNRALDKGLERNGVQFEQIIWILAVLITCFLILLPIGWLLIKSMISEGNISGVLWIKYLLNDRSTIQAVVNTIILSSSVAAIGVLIGVPLAYGVSRTNMLGKKLVQASIVLAIITPPFLRTMAYILLLGPNAGYINMFLRRFFFPELTRGPISIYSMLGMILLCTPSGIAQVFVLVSSTLSHMDPSLEEAARIGGAGFLKTAWTVAIKMSRNAIYAAALMTFTVTLALYGTPHMLGIDVITTRIRRAILMPINFDQASVLSGFIVVLAILALYLYRRFVGNMDQFQTVTGKGFRPKVLKIGKFRHLFTFLGLVYGFLSFVLPYSSLILMSLMRTVGEYGLDNFTLKNYLYVFTDSFSLNAIKNSTILAVGSATVCVLLSIVISYIVVRTKIKGRALLDYISVLPLGVPGTALAVGLVLVYTSPPLRGLGFYGTLWILFIAYLTRFLPKAVRTTGTSFMQIGKELEEAARMCGAGWFSMLRRVTIPLVKQGIAYAWVLVFLAVLPELSSSVLLRHLGNDTVATAILDIWGGAEGFPKACAMGSAVFLLVAIVFLHTQRMVKKSALDIN